MTERDPAEFQRLLFAAAGGDEDAWSDLVAAYMGRVFALIRSQGVDPDLAEEIAQSTFCTVATKLPEYTELGRFESWLFRIAMNRLRDEMRRRKRHATAVESEQLTTFAGAAGDDDRADSAQLHALRNAMARLPDADQHVLQLRHYAGLSFRQIAEILGQPLGTVLARQHRALQKLADLMDTSGNGAGGED